MDSEKVYYSNLNEISQMRYSWLYVEGKEGTEVSRSQWATIKIVTVLCYYFIVHILTI